jgi:hypothetical protein
MENQNEEQQQQGEVHDADGEATEKEQGSKQREGGTPRATPVVSANLLEKERQYLTANDMDGRRRLAAAFFRSGLVPKSYTSAEAVFAGMELALELRLKPFSALKYITLINGSPAIWGDLPLSLVRRGEKLDRIEEFFFDKEYNKICFANKNLSTEVYGALCRTWHIDADEALETYFTLDDAKLAGLLNKGGPWTTYRRRMLQMRARSQNLKDGYGDSLLGLDIAEYDWNHMPEREVSPDRVTRKGPERDNAATINQTLEDVAHAE